MPKAKENKGIGNIKLSPKLETDPKKIKKFEDAVDNELKKRYEPNKTLQGEYVDKDIDKLESQLKQLKSDRERDKKIILAKQIKSIEEKQKDNQKALDKAEEHVNSLKRNKAKYHSNKLMKTSKAKYYWDRFKHHSDKLNIFRISPSIPKDTYKNENVIHESIYPCKNKDGSKMTVGQYCKKFNWIHGFLKIKIFAPAVVLATKIFCKNMDDEPEDVWHNKNIKIFNDSWKESAAIMSRYMYGGIMVHKTYEAMRKMLITFAQNDSIPKEFLNVMCHTLCKNMQNAYKGHKEVYHVFYTDDKSYNPVYFTMIKAVMTENKSPAEVMGKMPEPPVPKPKINK